MKKEVVTKREPLQVDIVKLALPETDTEKNPLPENELLQRLKSPDGEKVIDRMVSNVFFGEEDIELHLIGLAGVGKSTITHALISHSRELWKIYGGTGRLIPYILTFGECLAEAEAKEEKLRNRTDEGVKAQLYQDASKIFFDKVSAWRDIYSRSFDPKKPDRHVLLTSSPFVAGISETSHYQIELMDKLATDPRGRANYAAVFGHPNILERTRLMRLFAPLLSDEAMQDFYEKEFDIHFYGLNPMDSPKERGSIIRATILGSARPERVEELKRFYTEAANSWIATTPDRNIQNERIRKLAKVFAFQSIDPREYKILLTQAVYEETRMKSWGLNLGKTYIILNDFLTEEKIPFYAAA